MAKHSSEESFSSDLMTRRGAERVFHLSPEPPAMGALNDYILAAKSTGDNKFFSFFLHHYEQFFCIILKHSRSFIEDPEEQTINVYPNPASSNLKVNFEGEANIQLFNLVGQMVYSTTATDNATINVSNLRSGVYMLKVNDKTVKVVVR